MELDGYLATDAWWKPGGVLEVFEGVRSHSESCHGEWRLEVRVYEASLCFGVAAGVGGNPRHPPVVLLHPKVDGKKSMEISDS